MRRSLVIATGARERFLPFPGWTLPGVVGVGGAQALLKVGDVVRGQVGRDRGERAAAASGRRVAARGGRARGAGGRAGAGAPTSRASRLGLWRRPRTLLQAARYRAGFARNAVSHRALGGRSAWRRTACARWCSPTDVARSVIACDVLCTGYGLVPNTELARLLGCDVTASGVAVDDAQATSVAGVFCAGEPTGIGGVDLALVEGEIAGLHAAGRAAMTAPLAPAARAPARTRRSGCRARSRSGMSSVALATPETIVCRCERRAARRAGCRTGRRGRRSCTRGSAWVPCQGRVCGPALGFMLGWPADSVRPPLVPPALGALAEVARPEYSKNERAVTSDHRVSVALEPEKSP